MNRIIAAYRITVCVVATSSLYCIYLLVKKRTVASSGNPASTVNELLQMRGTIPSEATLQEIKAQWEGSSTASGFLSIHPSAEGVLLAERQLIPNRVIGLPPYELGLNDEGRVLYIGYQRSEIPTATASNFPLRKSDLAVDTPTLYWLHGFILVCCAILICLSFGKLGRCAKRDS